MKAMRETRATGTEFKPIGSEAEYDEALAELERLWGAKIGTPESDRFDDLVDLIEAYEDKNYPMPMGSDPLPLRMRE
jgi:antitoxin component HigA of HigAB toxin-antitoxin module